MEDATIRQALFMAEEEYRAALCRAQIAIKEAVQNLTDARHSLGVTSLRGLQQAVLAASEASSASEALRQLLDS